jgi:hypothetical protein
MFCHNHYHLMAFTTPGESPLRYRQDNRKVSREHEDVAVIMEGTPQPGHTINLRAMPCARNSEPNRRALLGAKSRGPAKQVRATLYAEHVRQLGGESPLPNLMEVKG